MDQRDQTNFKLEEEAAAANLVLMGSVGDARYRLYRFKSCDHKQKISTTNVRNNSFECKACLWKTWEEEAYRVGLILVSASKKKGFNLYKYKDCEHFEELRVGSIRATGKSNKSTLRTCSKCFQKKLEEEAKAAGLILIGPAKEKDSNYRLYGFKDCLHQKEIPMRTVRGSSGYKCTECFEDTIKKEANRAGLTLIGKTSREDYYQYRHKQCGHLQEITLSDVRRTAELDPPKSRECKQCIEEKLSQEAKAAHLILIGSVDDSDYRLYRFRSCNHKQKIQTGMVRINSHDSVSLIWTLIHSFGVDELFWVSANDHIYITYSAAMGDRIRGV